MIKFKKNFEYIKVFVIAFFAFIAANYFYNNIVTKSTANSIKFREIEVQLKGNINLELNCKGANDPNSSSKNRGLGETTTNNCIGEGTFSATIPQQRFVEDPS